MYIYFIREKGTKRYKIGISKSPTRRLKELQTSNSKKLELVCCIRGDSWFETQIHHLFSHLRCEGGQEWFRADDGMEKYIQKIKAIKDISLMA